MSLSDDFAKFTAILNARAPQIALTSGGQATSLAVSVLAIMNQVDDSIVAATPNISVLTAVGDNLDALGANYGATRPEGTQSIAAVGFGIPAAVTTDTVISTGCVVEVPALGNSQPSFPFTTLQDATIPAGSTTSNLVQAQAYYVGLAGNVSANSILDMVTQLGDGIDVIQANPVDGGTYGGITTVLGTDAASDAKFLGIIQPLIDQKYGATQIQDAVINVPGVYDCLVVASGTVGTINVYWAAQDGTQPGGVGTAVDLAVRTVLVVGLLPTYPTFTVTQITTLAITYSAPAALQSAAIEPLIQQAVVNWIQGFSGAPGFAPGLRHDQTIIVLQLGAYVQGVLGNVLTDFKVTSSIPAIGATTLYRINAGVSAVVLTRV